MLAKHLAVDRNPRANDRLGFSSVPLNPDRGKTCAFPLDVEGTPQVPDSSTTHAIDLWCDRRPVWRSGCILFELQHNVRQVA